jgi:hypothetical protein
MKFCCDAPCICCCAAPIVLCPQVVVQGNNGIFMVMEYVEHDLKYILELQKAKKVCRSAAVVPGQRFYHMFDLGAFVMLLFKSLLDTCMACSPK